MKNLKSVMAVLAALCLLLCLTVPVFATETLTTTAAVTSADATTTGAVTTGTTDPTEAVEEGFEGAQPGADVEEGDIQIPIGDETLPVDEVIDEHDHDHDHEEEPESTGHKVLRIILTVLEVIASVALILVVLVQSGKEAGLSGAISGNSDSYMSKGNRATLDKKLATMTKWVALAWVVLTLLLSLI